MLRIGLTGGIAAGKSVVADRLRERGAVLVDADRLAREVVDPGTDGLAAVVEAFGAGILTPDGHLDRPALGAVVFADETARMTLNGIVHPRVRSEAARRIAAAPRDAVVVQDIPLLVETGQADAFGLVVVVEAPGDARVRRMVEQRGMSAEDARARMGAQATDEERAAAADVLLRNDGTVEALTATVDRLWDERIVPFEDHLLAERPAEAAMARVTGATSTVDTAPPDDGMLSRAAARIRHAGGNVLVREAAGPGAGGGPDLVVEAGPDGAAALARAITEAGFPPVPVDATASRSVMDLLHASADPGQPVVVLVRSGPTGPAQEQV